MFNWHSAANNPSKGDDMFFKQRNKKDGPQETTTCEQKPDENSLKLTTEALRSVLGENSDVAFKEIYINGNEDLCTTLLYVEGMINTKTVNDDILKPLIQESRLSEDRSLKGLIKLIEYGTVYHAAHKTRTDINDCINDVISGSAALIFDSERKAITFDVKGFEKRAITEPTGENVQKGAKDVFVETLRVNTATVRRRIKTPKLRIVQTIVGRQSMTAVAVVYIEGLTNKHLVDEVKKRLDNIQIDELISPGHIEEYISDSRTTMFPQIAATERPDKFCSNIVSGMVGLVIDGLPIAYIVPATINQLMQAPEDYAHNYIVSSFIRSTRYFLMVLTLFFPGVYISVTTFHHEMIPKDLALSIVATKEGVPLPAFIEVLLMLFAFEILLEAGMRLPKTIGQALSIVGALILGEAAAAAKIVSPSVVIVVAITGIAGFTMSNLDFSNALRLWRLIIAVLSSIAGLFGLTIGGLILLFHYCTLESFGVPYLSPFVTADGKSWTDTVFRLPLFLHKKRPKELHVTNKRRQK